MIGARNPVRFFRLLRLGLIGLPFACLAAQPAFEGGVPPPPGPASFPSPVPSSAPLTNLVFDKETQIVQAVMGQAEAKFTFQVTNISDVAVHIIGISASCGCTHAIMPETPWILTAHTNVELHAVMNLAGKPLGENGKYLTIASTNGTKQLWVKTFISPAPVTMSDRQKNQEIARANRQAVFQNDCVQCHVTPAMGKVGKELYSTACGICHDSNHRAQGIQDLLSLNRTLDAEFWRSSILGGKTNSLMPAFGQEQGGPLTKEQVDSLVAYLTTDFPREHQPTPQLEPHPDGQPSRAAMRLPPPRAVTPIPSPVVPPPAVQVQPPGK